MVAPSSAPVKPMNHNGADILEDRPADHPQKLEMFSFLHWGTWLCPCSGPQLQRERGREEQVQMPSLSSSKVLSPGPDFITGLSLQGCVQLKSSGRWRIWKWPLDTDNRMWMHMLFLHLSLYSPTFRGKKRVKEESTRREQSVKPWKENRQHLPLPKILIQDALMLVGGEEEELSSSESSIRCHDAPYTA